MTRSSFSTSKRTTRSKLANPAPGVLGPNNGSNANRTNVEDEIRTHAYLLYEQEGRQPGRDLEYWCRAEAEVLARRGQSVN